MRAIILNITCSNQEEDATVWARYSSAQFEQGAGKHACNNPYANEIDNEVFKETSVSKIWQISYENFKKLINPSFAGVEEKEDMDAIMARTHLIVITDNGIYHRLASTSKDPVPFIRWEDGMPKDLLDPSQQAIFKAYKMDPRSKIYPPSYHEDMAWSQEFLRKVLNGETIPRTISIIHASGFGMHRTRLVLKTCFVCG